MRILLFISALVLAGCGTVPQVQEASHRLDATPISLMPPLPQATQVSSEQRIVAEPGPYPKPTNIPLTWPTNVTLATHDFKVSTSADLQNWSEPMDPVYDADRWITLLMSSNHLFYRVTAEPKNF